MEDTIQAYAPLLCADCTDSALCEKHAAARRSIDKMMGSHKLEGAALETVNYSETNKIIPISRASGGLSKNRAAFIEKMKNTPVTNRITGESYLVPELKTGTTWRCEHCKCDVNATSISGFLVDRAGIGGLVPCPVCTPVVARSRGRKRALKFIDQLVIDGVFFNKQNMPVDSDDLTMDNYPASGDQLAKQKVQRFINGEIENILLSGDTGVGKTGLATAAANALALQGRQVLIVAAAQYITMLKDNFQEGARENHIKDIVKSVEYLFFDDLGAEGATEYTLKEIQELMEGRKNAGLKTCITTNFSLEGLKRYWHLPTYEATGFQPGARTISRLKGWYHLVSFNCPELR